MCSSDLGDELIANEADDAGEERRQREEQSRGCCGVAVRRTQEVKKIATRFDRLGSSGGFERLEDRIGFVVCCHRVDDLILSVGLMLMGLAVVVRFAEERDWRTLGLEYFGRWRRR